MAQKIESDKLLIRDVFKKWYRIPEYQRPYVWQADNVTELLDDIFQMRNSNQEAEYFLGSMVLKKSEIDDGNTKYEEYDLLDGQQRVTTLFLITAVVRDLTTNNESRVKTCRDTIYQMANADDNIPERIRIVFDIRDKVKWFVDEYVKADGGTAKEDELITISNKSEEDISIKNMANAIMTIRNYFNNGRSIDDFFPFLRSNVLMIYVAAEELEDAFHLFTVMNSRGIKLRNSDILKAQNLAKVKDEKKRIEYAKQWELVEEYYGEDFDNFLSHLRTILVKQKAGYNLLKEFEDNIYLPKEYDRLTKKYTSKKPLLDKGESTFKFINKYHSHYQSLFDDENYTDSSTYELYNQIQLMEKGFEADLWVPPLLRYYDKFKNESLLVFVKSLEQKFATDWLIGYTPTIRIENMNAIIQKIDDSQTPLDILNSNVLNLDTIGLSAILSSDTYGRRAAKYLLLKIDLLYHGNTTKFNLPNTISIEHILPQNPYADSQWKKDFSDSDRIDLTNKIGNLVLISRRKNSSQSNKDYIDKKEKYFKNNIELFSNSIRIYNQYSEWKLADLKRNQKEVLHKLFTSFNISMP